MYIVRSKSRVYSKSNRKYGSKPEIFTYLGFLDCSASFIATRNKRHKGFFVFFLREFFISAQGSFMGVEKVRR